MQKVIELSKKTNFSKYTKKTEPRAFQNTEAVQNMFEEIINVGVFALQL